MTQGKQQKAIGVVAIIAVLLLLAAQFILQHLYRSTQDELFDLRGQLEQVTKQVNSTNALVAKYRVFEVLASPRPDQPERIFPAAGSELYGAIERSLKAYDLEYTNRSQGIPNQKTKQITLQIDFKGSYYNVLRALAAIRESEYVMRISSLKLEAENDGNVSGSMTVLSVARS